MNNILYTLMFLVFWVLRIYYYVLIAYVLLSWIPDLRKTSFYRFIYKLANPYMRLFRGLLVIGHIDLTPILGFILYNWGLSYLERALYLMS
ncbi:MAG: YggT family protein [Candidatus Izimaplasma sp.]|nr:YggT family protein [Candidatus Izimaplasma bacterium]